MTPHTARVVELALLPATADAPVRVSALDSSGRIIIWRWRAKEGAAV